MEEVTAPTYEVSLLIHVLIYDIYMGPLILAWIIYHLPNKVWEEITYPFQISSAFPLKFGNG